MDTISIHSKHIYIYYINIIPLSPIKSLINPIKSSLNHYEFIKVIKCEIIMKSPFLVVIRCYKLYNHH